MTIRFEYDGLPIIKTTSGELKGYKYDGIYTYKGTLMHMRKDGKWLNYLLGMVYLMRRIMDV